MFRPSLEQQFAAPGFRETFDGVAQGGAGNDRAVTEEEPFQPGHVALAGFA